MAVYAVGDIQGCYTEFRSLLDSIGFDEDRDQLWLAGDLVNRGPDSLAVLRFVSALGDRAVCVLGNHDLHLLAVACGARSAGKRDTLDAVLAAPDAQELLDWLRHRSLLHYDKNLGWLMVHAGLAPQWDVETAQSCARELETHLRSDDYKSLLEELFSNHPNRWQSDLRELERLRFTTNCLTRLRYCHRDGRTSLQHSGAPGTQPPGLLPWFEAPDRESRETRIVFGHWSTLGTTAFTDAVKTADIDHRIRDLGNVLPLDGGCVWGGTLFAARLDGKTALHGLACSGHQVPGT